jgi:signal transduction histidine kinase
MVSVVGAGSLAIGLAVSLWVGYVCWQNRSTPGTVPLAVFTAALVVWQGSHALVHLTPAAIEPLFERFVWLGVVTAPVAWFAFVLEYTGQDRLLTRRTVAALLVWPVVLTGLLWVPLVTGAVGLPLDFGVWTRLQAETGLAFWTTVAVAYGLTAVGTVLLAVTVSRTQQLLRNQGLTLLAGVGVLWLGNVVAVFELFGSLHIHGNTLGFALAAIAFAWAIERRELADITPIPRGTIVDSMSTAVVTVDTDGRVTDLNPAARDLFDVTDDEPAVGTQAATLFEGAVELDDDATFDGLLDGTETEVAVGDRRFLVSVLSITGRSDRALGTLFYFHDISEQDRQRDLLERQNERLEKFASIISHDLRNPLNVASGNLAVAQERYDDEQLATVADSLDRMETIVDDTLTLAREGQTVVDPDLVAIDTVAKEAWDTTEIDTGTLVVEDSLEVLADASRLLRLFENLFRNALDHSNEETVTVRVGRLDDGFFVADDGPGIPAEDRDEIFEFGYSDADGGTGIGLAIVESIAEAHGWSVSVTESSDGGARFEIRNVAIA